MAAVREVIVIWLIWLISLFVLSRTLLSHSAPITSGHVSKLRDPTNQVLYVASTQRGLRLPTITRRECRQRVRFTRLTGSSVFRHQRSQYLSTILATCLLLSGDVELNPGPTFKFPCARCERPVKSNQKGLQCDACDRWFHCACEHVPTVTYLALGNCEDNWFCAQCSLPPLSDSFFELPSVDADMSGLNSSCLVVSANGDEEWESTVSNNPFPTTGFSVLQIRLNSSTVS